MSPSAAGEGCGDHLAVGGFLGAGLAVTPVTARPVRLSAEEPQLMGSQVPVEPWVLAGRVSGWQERTRLGGGCLVLGEEVCDAQDQLGAGRRRRSGPGERGGGAGSGR